MATNTNTESTRTERTARPYAEILQEALLTAEHHLRRNRGNERLRAFYLGQRHAHAEAYEMVTGVPAQNVQETLDRLPDDYVASLSWLGPLVW